MIAVLILAISVAVQAASLILAIRLIPLTRRAAPWALISLGFLLIIIRRSIHIGQLASTGMLGSPTEVQEAMLNLLLSTFFLLGVLWIRPQFEAMVRTERQLREASQELEQRVQLRTAELAKSVDGLREEMASRQQAEHELRAGEAHTRALVTAIPDQIVRLGLNGKYLEAITPRAFQSVWMEDDYLGKSIHDVLPADRAGQLAEALERAFATSQVQSVNYSVTLADGEVRHREARLVRSGQDEALAIIRDVTDQQRAEQALAEQLRFMQVLLDALPVAVFCKDTAGRYTVSNRRYGQGVGDIIGKTNYDLLPKEEADYFAGLDAEILANPAGQVVERSGHLADGSAYHHLIHRAPFLDGQCRMAGIIGAVVDISARKQTEDALRASEATNRAILNAIPDQLVRFRRDGRFLEIFVPPGFQPIWHPEDHLNKTVRETLPPDRAERIMDILKQAFDTGQVQAIEYRAGRDLYREVRVAVCGQDEALALVRDITERKRAEEQLKATNLMLEELTFQLQTLARQLTQAERRERHRVAVLIHDQIQQLLAAAKVRLGMLNQQLSDAASSDLAGQIKDLLDEAIDIARTLAYEISPPVMHEIGLCSALDWLAEDINDKHGLVVSLDSEGEIRDDAAGVCDLLYQCVRELLLNVIKHAKVKSAKIVVRRVDDEQVRIAVEDDGVGFDPATVQRGRSGAGGFGLFTIRERLSLLGGRLQIDSVPGRGSRFILEAPVSSVPPPDEAQAQSVPDQRDSGPTLPSPAGPAARLTARIRVVMADDHVMMRQGLSDILGRQEDIEVVGQAADGAEAVKLAVQLKPDVVIMDVRMPGMNGLDATRRLRAVVPGVQVIGLSLHDDPKTAAAMRQAGAAAYLAKGGPIEALVAAIRAVSSASRRLHGAN